MRWSAVAAPGWQRLFPSFASFASALAAAALAPRASASGPHPFERSASPSPRVAGRASARRPCSLRPPSPPPHRRGRLEADEPCSRFGPVCFRLVRCRQENRRERQCLRDEGVRRRVEAARQASVSHGALELEPRVGRISGPARRQQGGVATRARATATHARVSRAMQWSEAAAEQALRWLTRVQA